MYTNRKFYPDLEAPVELLPVTHCIKDDNDSQVYVTSCVLGTDKVEFNPNYKVISPDSFSLSSQIKSGSPLSPSPRIASNDMIMSDKVIDLFNKKIVS